MQVHLMPRATGATATATATYYLPTRYIILKVFFKHFIPIANKIMIRTRIRKN